MTLTKTLLSEQFPAYFEAGSNVYATFVLYSSVLHFIQTLGEVRASGWSQVAKRRSTMVKGWGTGGTVTNEGREPCSNNCGPQGGH